MKNHLSKKNKIGIIVVHYGNPQDTIELLGSLSKINIFNGILYLVDNDPKNRLRKIPQYNFKINYIKSKKNLGWAGGADFAARKAYSQGCDTLCFLTCDTVINDKFFLDKMTKPLGDTKIGATIPLVVFHNNPNRIWSAGGKLYKLIAYTKHYDYNRFVTIKNLNKYPDFGGIGLTMRSDVYKKIGGWDPNYFLYYEDVDICFKILKRKLKIKLVSQAIVEHKATTPSRGIEMKLSPFSSFHYGRSAFIFIKKNLTGFGVLTAIFGQIFIRAPLFMIAMMRQNNFKALKSYVHGSLSGVKEVLF
ncbi:MAG: putative glycosyltransferase [uncultured bacterium]|uniref:Putative glycosyltransferase n=1 Tax=Candidatus Woesebacteria bacterium GW2011_GWA1_40_43 TaxID=1618553 RepID=A0A0G0VPT6_9BACT|nr:MAG: putative glycosyltransferase [uncultured bacterium]KKR53914.1 MAG: putative glycosyltransferase [Candidatus Woesebacteria bacterium GW2011_GWD2_40_19]KKR58632.1 MAG: putative glycosyltransferase [Candidatus Woesebacteria bacterium GW2011_GWC2_40_30]KKR64757.1 MAG: putative glycosyltransferase [Candidatus Woesebacteria bacterium GW2011_GWA1_40_43]HAU65323.1 hypothetical protein [Candidatus Woesebacteria bacterium]